MKADVGRDLVERVQHDPFGIGPQESRPVTLTVARDLDEAPPERLVQKLVQRHGSENAAENPVGVLKDHEQIGWTSRNRVDDIDHAIPVARSISSCVTRKNRAAAYAGISILTLSGGLMPAEQ